MAADDPTAQPDRIEALREATTMALYISLSLLAVLLATPIPEDVGDRAGEALVILLTAVGLLLAHQVAFRLTDRLISGGSVRSETVAAVRAQNIGGLSVAVVAALPPLLFGGATGLAISSLLLLGFVAGVGYAAIRRGGRSRGAALAYMTLLVVLVLGIVTLKVVTH